MSDFIFVFKELLHGKSLARAYTHLSMRGMMLSGRTVDIGGGRGASYLAYMNANDARIEGFDLKNSRGITATVDFETDRLPLDDGTVDNVLMFNILEHIYHHAFLVSEVARVLKKDGRLIGFVPFLVNYHPDPHDYFRYTGEALSRILDESGFTEVTVRELGKGPFVVNFNNLVPSLNRFIAAAFLPVPYVLDSVLTRLRPNIGRRYPLGYLFEAKKL